MPDIAIFMNGKIKFRYENVIEEFDTFVWLKHRLDDVKLINSIFFFS